jgi:hypothetical protein
MLAGSLSIKKRCFSFGTVKRDDLSSVRPLLHQIGVHQMDDFQCSSDDRLVNWGKSGHLIRVDMAGSNVENLHKVRLEM